MSDLITECADGSENHGQFVTCVSHLTNSWKNDGFISGKEKGAIQSCAANSGDDSYKDDSDIDIMDFYE